MQIYRQKGNLAGLWSRTKVTLSSWLYLSYFPFFMLRDVKPKKQHSTIYAVKNDAPILHLVHSECRVSNETGTSCLFMLFQSINSCKSSSKAFMFSGSARAWLSCIYINNNRIGKPKEGSECLKSSLFSHLVIPLEWDMSFPHATQGH